LKFKTRNERTGGDSSSSLPRLDSIQLSAAPRAPQSAVGNFDSLFLLLLVSLSSSDTSIFPETFTALRRRRSSVSKNRPRRRNTLPSYTIPCNTRYLNYIRNVNHVIKRDGLICSRRGNIFRFGYKMKFRVKRRVTNSLIHPVVHLRKTQRRYFTDNKDTSLRA